MKSIKIKVSMTCVLIEDEVKRKDMQQQYTQIQVKLVPGDYMEICAINNWSNSILDKHVLQPFSSKVLNAVHRTIDIYFEF